MSGVALLGGVTRRLHHPLRPMLHSCARFMHLSPRACLVTGHLRAGTAGCVLVLGAVHGACCGSASGS